MKTLIVEDDSSMRSLFGAILRARGHEVTECSSAESALESFARESYELVLLDWMLAGMDGLELCRELRRMPAGESSVVVMITARNQPDDLQAVLEAGADDYLAKPVRPELLGIRIVIAESLVRNRAERNRAQRKLTRAMHEIEKSHDDLLSILNRLRVGTAMTDADGQLIFLSELARRLLSLRPDEGLGRAWESVFPFCHDDLALLTEMVGRYENDREKVPVRLESSTGRRFWMEIEVQDDPRDERRKIFVFYDVSEVQDLREMLDKKAQFHQLVGRSELMLQLYQQIRDVAAVDSTVLIEGATGTGKELVARAIHSASHRATQPFIPVNCAGLTDSLLTSQLFGHRRGAFTGATTDHEGLFESANGGTIFLDEIGDIPLNVQTSLLRVLQEKEVTRVGESKPRKVDVRIVAATHHDLSRDVTNGAFRADLFYRIRVARLNIPILRERREDIPLLIAAFLGQLRASTGKAVERVSHDALRLLTDYPWPGNVRELRSAIEFAVIRCRGAVIQAEDLPRELSSSPETLLAPVRRVDAEGPQGIVEALERTGGNRAAAAKLLGVSRATFYRRLAKLDWPPEK